MAPSLSLEPLAHCLLPHPLFHRARLTPVSGHSPPPCPVQQSLPQPINKPGSCLPSLHPAVLGTHHVQPPRLPQPCPPQVIGGTAGCNSVPGPPGQGRGAHSPKGQLIWGPAPLCTWPHFQVGSGAIGMPFFLLTRTPHALCASDPPWNGVIGGPPHGVGGYMQRGDSVAHSGCMATRAGHRAGRERPGYWRQWGPWGGGTPFPSLLACPTVWGQCLTWGLGVPPRAQPGPGFPAQHQLRGDPWNLVLPSVSSTGLDHGGMSSPN